MRRATLPGLFPPFCRGPVPGVDRRGGFYALDLADDDEPTRAAVLDLYDRFTPLGIAQGLPPRRPEQRREWVGLLFDRGINLLATRGREAVGHASVVDLVPGESWEYLVFVHPDHQGIGIGTALTEAARTLARTLGCPRVWLTVEDRNRRAIRVYEKVGFRADGPSGPEIDMVLDPRGEPRPCGLRF